VRVFIVARATRVRNLWRASVVFTSMRQNSIYALDEPGAFQSTQVGGSSRMYSSTGGCGCWCATPPAAAWEAAVAAVTGCAAATAAEARVVADDDVHRRIDASFAHERRGPSGRHEADGRATAPHDGRKRARDAAASMAKKEKKHENKK
jgi:hypothetical protein